MKRKINRAIIVVNLLKEEAKILLKCVQDYFAKKQVEVQVFPVQNDFKPGMIQYPDIALTIGGDGTLLYCARVFAQSCIGRYRADGVILATPTGSIAYSMSAGGPHA